MKNPETIITDVLKLADIQINGSRPWDITVHDKRLYGRLIRDRELGLGEAYMDGWWDCPRIDQMIEHLFSADATAALKLSPSIIAVGIGAKISGAVANRQTVGRARRNASHHYDIGNDLYERMLDKRMIYTCGYWQDAKTLDQAQENKLDLICRKLQLKKGMKLLDIGCGWGGFSEYAARKYGAIVTGVTPAAEQVKLAKKRTKGLNVTILQQDYREVEGTFDRIVSIGMLEHVGIKNFPVFFETCDRLLAPGGMMLHHTVGDNYHHDPVAMRWTNKYIFPGAMIPALDEIVLGSRSKFVIEDVHNFGPDYDTTLMAWHHNFVKTYPEISDKYDERFRRMWEYYLLTCAGTFRVHGAQLWQIVMRRPQAGPVYKSVR